MPPCIAEYVHAHINIGDQETVTERIQFIFRPHRIQSSHNYVATFQRVTCRLPLRTNGFDFGSGPNAEDQSASNIDFRGRILYVSLRATHEPVQIGVFNQLRVNHNEVSNTDVRQLLRNVGPTASQAHDADRDLVKGHIAV